MAHDLCDDLELAGGGGGDYYYFDDDDDDFGDGFPTIASGGASGLQHEQMDDTSASDYKEGKDIQGIPWERLNYSRDQYREMRLKEYKNYQNLTRSRSGLEQECKQVERKDTFYDFHSSTRSVKSTIVHFQEQKQVDMMSILSSRSTNYRVAIWYGRMLHDRKRC